MNVSKFGEFGLIEKLARIAGSDHGDLLIGIGDDAAVWRAGGQYLLGSTDTLVEGVHFTAGQNRWSDAGWKALAVNVSDIAAMGGQPLFALVTLAVPSHMQPEALEWLYEGLAECARNYEVAIAGGDIVGSPQFSITVALIGAAQQAGGEPLLLRRDAASPGDCIAVTGTLGDSAAGLRRLTEGASDSGRMVSAHLRPHPPLATGSEAVRAGLRCAIDVSDGLLQDVGHICTMSGLGARVTASRIPLSSDLLHAFPDEALALACNGGEDYQLVLIGPEERIEQLQPHLSDQLTVIGEIVAGEPRVSLLDDEGREMEIPARGWDHLRPPA